MEGKSQDLVLNHLLKLYVFSKAKMKVHNNRYLLSRGSAGARSSRSMLQQGMKENVLHASILASGGLLAITDDFLTSAASPPISCLHLHMPVCVHICV